MGRGGCQSSSRYSRGICLQGIMWKVMSIFSLGFCTCTNRHMHLQTHTCAPWTHTSHTHCTCMPHKHTNTILRHVEETEISWIPHLNTNVSIITLNVNPLNMKQQRHWIVEQFSPLTSLWLCSSGSFIYQSPEKRCSVGSQVWLTASWYFRIQELQLVPQFGYTLVSCRTHCMSWDSLLCSGTYWCVLVLIGVFQDSLMWPGIHWYIPKLSGKSWDSWCVMGLCGVFWDSLVCSGTHWCVLELSGMSWNLPVFSRTLWRCPGTP